MTHHFGILKDQFTYYTYPPTIVKIYTITGMEYSKPVTGRTMALRLPYLLLITTIINEWILHMS